MFLPRFTNAQLPTYKAETFPLALCVVMTAEAGDGRTGALNGDVVMMSFLAPAAAMWPPFANREFSCISFLRQVPPCPATMIPPQSPQPETAGDALPAPTGGQSGL